MLRLFFLPCNPLPSSEGRRRYKRNSATRDTLQSTSLIRGKTDIALQTPSAVTTLQSTSLIRGKTKAAISPIRIPVFFNPLPSSEGRPKMLVTNSPVSSLQSTSLIRGKTDTGRMMRCCNWHLQSTSLIRGKTFTTGNQITFNQVFNPLPSSEGRPDIREQHRAVKNLQSTSLIRGKTCPAHRLLQGMEVFNPLPSSEGRHQVPEIVSNGIVLQSTSLIRGKTSLFFALFLAVVSSIHFPHPREDSKTS